MDGLVNDGAAAAEKYPTGYLVEKTLGVDNIFVLGLLYVFTSFLLVTGLKMLWARERTWDPRTSPLLRLAGLVGRFHSLKPALAFGLLLVATQMLCAEWLEVMLGPRFTLAVLGAVASIIASGVVASIVADVRDRQRSPAAA